MYTNKASVHNQITRRTFLGASAATVVMAAAGSALAQQPVPAQQAPRVKGPRVWLVGRGGQATFFLPLAIWPC